MMKPYINCYYHIITNKWVSTTPGLWTGPLTHTILKQLKTLLKAFSVILDILPITLYSGTGHSKKRYTFNRYI